MQVPKNGKTGANNWDHPGMEVYIKGEIRGLFHHSHGWSSGRSSNLFPCFFILKWVSLKRWVLRAWNSIPLRKSLCFTIWGTRTVALRKNWNWFQKRTFSNASLGTCQVKTLAPLNFEFGDSLSLNCLVFFCEIALRNVLNLHYLCDWASVWKLFSTILGNWWWFFKFLLLFILFSCQNFTIS